MARDGGFAGVGALLALLTAAVFLAVAPTYGLVSLPPGAAATLRGEKMTYTRGLDISGKVNAPSLDGAVGWLNVDHPLTIQELRGKIVLLDFWTYCCINCMHVIPDLKRLERKYADELIVIGIHSAKFANEKESANIREAILRYDIEHPVANDANFAIWQRYSVHAWPTLVLIDPDGKIVGTISGEGVYDTLDEHIAALVEKFGSKINRKPIALALEKNKMPATALAFPGKVDADAAGKRLFIADSSHNRIVITDFDGKVIDVAGSGLEGMTDGTFEKAEFNHPQGMALDGDHLYVADTENHLLRRLDLVARVTQTVAGTGQQSRTWVGGPDLKTGLNSPWDVTMVPGSDNVYIAMAGSHQIWVYKPDARTVEPYAGSGVENIVDGSLATAALAQPSGITTDGADLFFADSEVSALRTVETSNGKRVKTLIGKGLFEFGDVDGPFQSARLQHPLGVAYASGRIFIADTYNHKIKVAEPAVKRIRTIVGTGKPGMGTSEAPQFYEPGGLSIADGKIFVADTNNNAVRVVDLATHEVTTLNIDSSALSAPKPKAVFHTGPNPEHIDLQGKSFPAHGEVAIALDLPEGTHLNPDAKPVVQLRVTGDDGKQWVSDSITPAAGEKSITFKIDTGEIKSPKKIEAAITFYFCKSGAEGACYIGADIAEGPVVESTGTLELTQKVKKP